MNGTISMRPIALLLCLPLVFAGISSRAADDAQPVLTLRRAQELAMQRHPRISAADFRALAAKQTVSEVRSAFYPTFSANFTAVRDAGDNTRIAAGSLSVSSVLDRAAAGIVVSQLITDFGRTANLTDSTKLHARAEERNTDATRTLILVQVSSAYFSVLQAQSVLSVAKQTIATRKLLLDQVEALAKNQLKSDLDVSFARVNHEDALLLEAKAVNDLKASFAGLSTLLGDPQPREYQLAEEIMPPALDADTAKLVEQALRDRPELARLRLERDSAQKFARAEKGLDYPTVSALAAVGVVPVRDNRLNDNYAVAGVNLSLPLFSGGLYKARQEEAGLRAKAADQSLLDAENDIIREVRVARLNVDYTAERVTLTAKLLEHASRALNLADARYQRGLSSIVELSQAQLNKTAAEIAQATAKYDYLIQRAVLNYQTGSLK